VESAEFVLKWWQGLELVDRWPVDGSVDVLWRAVEDGRSPQVFTGSSEGVHKELWKSAVVVPPGCGGRRGLVRLGG